MSDSALYLTDAYLREFDSRVVRSSPGEVVLESTAFYPQGGGQPFDQGSLLYGDGRRFNVEAVEKSEGGIVHRGSGEAPGPGSQVRGVLDWSRRYAHMRYHTCLHILSGVVFRNFGSVITGGQIYQDRARMDLSLPDLSRERMEEVLLEMNRVVEEDHPIHVRFLSRAEAERDPTLVRVARELLPNLETIRLIDIEGFDVQADGGTHVRSTREVGRVTLQKFENKGSKNKRLYLTVEPAAPSSSGSGS
jgi:Ser-tRNA(Ala) deacylase AlaX